LEVARGLFPSFQGDVRLVELVSLSDPGLVPTAVAKRPGLKIRWRRDFRRSVARAIGDSGFFLFSIMRTCNRAAAKLAETIVACVHEPPFLRQAGRS